MHLGASKDGDSELVPQAKQKHLQFSALAPLQNTRKRFMSVFQLEHTYMFVNPFCCCLFPSQSPRGRFLKLFKTPETFQSCKAVPKIKICIHLKLPSVHINPLTPEGNCPRSTPNSLAFFGTFQSERKHKNRPYTQ